jgi:hypothetical protein
MAPSDDAGSIGDNAGGKIRRPSVLKQPRPHPLNGDFVWSSCTAPLRRLTEAQRDQFNTLGFIKVEGVYSADEIAAITAAIDPLEAKAEQRLREAGGAISISTSPAIRSWSMCATT